MDCGSAAGLGGASPGVAAAPGREFPTHGRTKSLTSRHSGRSPAFPASCPRARPSVLHASSKGPAGVPLVHRRARKGDMSPLESLITEPRLTAHKDPEGWPMAITSSNFLRVPGRSRCASPPWPAALDDQYRQSSFPAAATLARSFLCPVARSDPETGRPPRTAPPRARNGLTW